MGRHSRKFGVRLRAVAAFSLCSAACLHRWSLRSSAVQPLPADRDGFTPAPLTRSERFARVSAPPDSEGSSVHPVTDVLVVGGGLTGLYTALEAAQRGLSVVLVEAGDLGSGFTTRSPGIAPGPVPYLQRAFRQREWEWVREAFRVMRRHRVWRNVTRDDDAGTPQDAERCGIATKRVALVAPHFTEMLEFGLVGLLATALSVLFGPLEVHCRPLSRSALLSAMRADSTALLAMESPPRGAIISVDSLLHTPNLCVRVARTAEALGAVVLPYTSLSALCMRVESNGERIFCATVEDHIAALDACTLTRGSAATPFTRHIYAKAVVNCSGAYVDGVKSLLPENQMDALPHTFDSDMSYRLQCFLVAPRQAVQACGNPAAEGSRSSLLDRLGVDGLHTIPTRFSFSSSLVMPWRGDTVLVGPSFAVLPALPSLSPLCQSGYQSTDGFRAASLRAVEALRSSGIAVERSDFLTCLVNATGILRSPQEVPWLSDYVFKNYHVSLSRPVLRERTTNEKQAATMQVKRSPLVECASDGRQRDNAVDGLLSSDETSSTVLPFLHVYGGVPLQARDIAQEVVDVMLSKFAFPWQPSRSERLRLEPLPWSDEPTAAAIEAMARDGFVHRVSDIVFRRSSVAYTSPGEAAAAISSVAGVLGRVLCWTPQRVQIEINHSLRELKSVCVQ